MIWEAPDLLLALFWGPSPQLLHSSKVFQAPLPTPRPLRWDHSGVARTPMFASTSFCSILKKTPLGRRIYAIGGNKVASQYGGINVKKYRVITFLFSGAFLAVASIIQTSRLGSGQPLAGEDFMLDTIAAVYLSTTMFGEGEPTPEGTIIGVFIITMLTNGLTMLGVEYYFQYITKGVVVILAVMMSVLLSGKARKA